jgi:hypothetical protein
MQLVALRNWLGGLGRGRTRDSISVTPVAEAGLIAPATSLPGEAEPPAGPHEFAIPPYWTTERLALTEELFGSGFVMPGGAAEVMRYIRPVGLSSAAGLLLLGAGSGGAGCAIAARFNAFVDGFEAEPTLAEAAAERSRQSRLWTRAPVAAWNPATPALRPNYYHHALALDALRGAPPEPVLTAIRGALKEGGHCVFVDLASASIAAARQREMVQWSGIERRNAPPPPEQEVSRLFETLGFDLRITEDLTDSHSELVLGAWQTLLRGLQRRPGREKAALLVAEAERWLLRLRLMRAGQLRLVRWHAILWNTQGSPPQASVG